MSYIGNPIVSTDFPVDYKSGNGSTTAFTLSIAPASVNSIDVQISGVSQSPQTYSVSGTTLTFSAAPPTGTNNIVVRHLGIAGIPNTPSAGSVVPASIGTGYALWNLSGSDINYTAGNVGIGTASPTKKLDVAGDFRFGTGSGAIATFNGSGYGQIISTPALYYDANYHYFRRGDGNLEFARFDTSGNFMVGTTGATGKTSIERNSQGTVLYALNSVSSSTGINIYSNASNTAAGTGWNHFYGQSSGPTANIVIYGNGNIQNANNSYGALSDIKLKENIVDATPKLDNLMQVKVRNYNLIGDSVKQLGVVAQELEQVFPSMIEETPDRDVEGNLLETTTKSVKYSVFVPMLLKAIQELNAKVDAQALEIKALKGTV